MKTFLRSNKKLSLILSLHILCSAMAPSMVQAGLLSNMLASIPLIGRFVVKKKGRGWWVFDGDAEPANATPLKKREVNDFIAELIE